MVLNICEPDMIAARRIASVLPPLPRSVRQETSHFSGADEPALGELLADPMLRRLLDSDGVQHDRLLSLIAAVRTRLAG